MVRKELDFVLKQNQYLKGGTKKAIVKVKEFLQHATNPGNQKEDTIPETWKCDDDCKRTSNLLCPGECNISKTSKKECPFFMDENLD